MTAPSIDRDPPQWATALARHRDGLRSLARFLVESEAGYPQDALDYLFAAVPADERNPLINELRDLYAPDSGFAIGDGYLVALVIDRLVYAYETHVAAAYQHGPHLGRWQDATVIAAAAVDQHADEILAALEQVPVLVGTPDEIAAKIGGA